VPPLRVGLVPDAIPCWTGTSQLFKAALTASSSPEGQKHDLILPLGKDEHAWGPLPTIDSLAKVPCHRLPVVSDQNSVFEPRIQEGPDLTFLAIRWSSHRDIDGRFARAQTFDDIDVDILIRQEADRTVTRASDSSAAGLPQAGQTSRDSSGSERHGSFEFTLTFSDILLDHLFVIEVKGDRTAHLRRLQCRKRLDDPFRRCALLEVNDNRVKGHASSRGDGPALASKQ
jgi:hypothetical protein